MVSNLTSAQCRILVVDPSGPVRQLMSDTLRKVRNFDSIESRSSINDALEYLEADVADWLLLPLSADQPVNALHILKLCTETPSLRHTRVSLFVNEEEYFVLPKAFELGCLSYHTKPFTKDTLTSDLTELFTVFDSHQANETLISAHYLRQHLTKNKDYAAIAELQKALLTLIPGDIKTLLYLAEPQFHLGHPEMARKTLRQVKLLDDNLKEQVDQVAKSLFPDEALDPSAEDITGTINIIDTDNAIIIDPDEASATAVEEVLKSLGCANIQRFSDGQSAWDYLEKNPEPELIFMEWRIPKVSGPSIIQRIRLHGFYSVPIFIISSLIKTEDTPLLKEIGIANTMEKPLVRERFIPTLLHTIRQERRPTEHAVLERKFHMLLNGDQISEAEPLRLQILNDKSIPTGRKRLIEAAFSLAKKDYDSARESAFDALKLLGEQIEVLNVLGKTLMRLNNFEAALKCFKKAQDLSPNNIERLCLIAESESELGNEKGTADALAQASAVDSGSAAVAQAAVKAAAKKIMSSFENIKNIVSYMNNMAVSLARSEKYEESIELYNKTAESIPEDRKDLQAIVGYNTALAKIRSGDLKGALVNLEIVEKIKDSKLSEKSTLLAEKLRLATETGAKVKLRSSKPKEDASPQAAADKNASVQNPDGQQSADSTATTETPAVSKTEFKLRAENQAKQMIAMVDVKRGDVCCFMIYSSPNPPTSGLAPLLEKVPVYKPRDTITRKKAFTGTAR